MPLYLALESISHLDVLTIFMVDKAGNIKVFANADWRSSAFRQGLFADCVSGCTFFSTTFSFVNINACLYSSSSNSTWKGFSVLTADVKLFFLGGGTTTVSLAVWAWSMQWSTGRGNCHWTVCWSHGHMVQFGMFLQAFRIWQLKLESNPHSWLAFEGMFKLVHIWGCLVILYSGYVDSSSTSIIKRVSVCGLLHQIPTGTWTTEVKGHSFAYFWMQWAIIHPINHVTIIKSEEMIDSPFLGANSSSQMSLRSASSLILQKHLAFNCS